MAFSGSASASPRRTGPWPATSRRSGSVPARSRPGGPAHDGLRVRAHHHVQRDGGLVAGDEADVTLVTFGGDKGSVCASLLTNAGCGNLSGGSASRYLLRIVAFSCVGPIAGRMAPARSAGTRTSSCWSASASSPTLFNPVSIYVLECTGVVEQLQPGRPRVRTRPDHSGRHGLLGAICDAQTTRCCFVSTIAPSIDVRVGVQAWPSGAVRCVCSR